MHDRRQVVGRYGDIMITIKLELDAGDGTPPKTTTVQLQPEQLKKAELAMRLLAQALRDPAALVQRLGAHALGRAVGRGLEKLLTPKPRK